MQKRSRWQKLGIFVGILGCAYAWHIFWPYVLTGGQDACSFGPVSNARYRAMLADAKEKQKTVWPSLEEVWGKTDYPGDPTKLGQGLEIIKRADSLSINGNIFLKIAAVHAVMRELKGRLRSSRVQIWTKGNQIFYNAHMTYNFDTIQSRFSNIRVGNFSNKAHFNIYARGSQEPISLRAYIDSPSTSKWNILKSNSSEGLFFSDYPPPPAGGPCPLVPDPALMPPAS